MPLPSVSVRIGSMPSLSRYHPLARSMSWAGNAAATRPFWSMAPPIPAAPRLSYRSERMARGLSGRVRSQLHVDPVREFAGISERIYRPGTELTLALFEDLVGGLVCRHGIPIRAGVGHRIERIGNGDYPARKRDVLARETVVPHAVPALVVPE